MANDFEFSQTMICNTEKPKENLEFTQKWKSKFRSLETQKKRVKFNTFTLKPFRFKMHQITHTNICIINLTKKLYQVL